MNTYALSVLVLVLVAVLPGQTLSDGPVRGSKAQKIPKLAHAAHGNRETTAGKMMIVIDTDAGSDDGVAILNLLGAEESSEDVRTLFITTVHGNTNVDNVGRNVLKILKTANRLNIPVYRGSNDSLAGPSDTCDYYGQDGFGDFPFPDPPPETLIRTKHAANALIDAVVVDPGKISLVCLGPLTNVALAAKLDPKFLKNLKEIFVLGGSDSGIGNIKPGIEFNFYMDPLAAHIVFKEAEKAGKLINLVTWETVSKRTKIEMAWRKNVLGTISNPAIDLINKAEAMHLKGDYWVSADTVLSAVVIQRGIVESSRDYHVDVETCGQFSRGAIFVDYDDEDGKSVKNARVIRSINSNRYKEMLLRNLGFSNLV